MKDTKILMNRLQKPYLGKEEMSMTTKHVHQEEIKKEKVNVECATISIVQHNK
jgi:hypothetical protein